MDTCTLTPGNVLMQTFIIDTSVLAYDPSALKHFKNALIVIPIGVVVELDNLKSKPGDVGRNARLAGRKLDELSQKGQISKGIKVGKSTIKVDCVEKNSVGDSDYMDNRILATAIRYSKSTKTDSVTIVSRDVNLRIRARAAGLFAEDYKKTSKSDGGLYKGYRDIVSDELGLLLQDEGFLDLFKYDEIKGMNPNECLSIAGSDGKGLALGRRVGDRIQLVRTAEAWGIRSRSREQAFALDMLMDPKLPLVVIGGTSGGGKTLLSVAAQLSQVVEEKRYGKAMIIRPLEFIGRELGALPGSKMEKIIEHYGPILDSFETLLGGGSSKKGDRWKAQLDLWMEKEVIVFEPVTYLRGRSLKNTLALVDESQNLSADLLKTVLTRMDLGSKIIITGDIDQIDVNNLDSENNMLVEAIEKFKTSNLAGSIVFNKTERSALAAEAIKLL